MKEGEIMKICRLLLHSFLVIILTASANAFLWVKAEPRILFLLIPAVSAVHLVSGAFFQNIPKKRLRVCNHGAALLIVFLISAGISVIFHTMLAFRLIPNDIGVWIWSAVFCIAMEAAVFWHGIICVYLTSAQLGGRLAEPSAILIEACKNSDKIHAGQIHMIAVFVYRPPDVE